MISVALDRNAGDPRPYIEAAAPTHPSLIDSGHVVADRYRIVNVPTVVWIDEGGRIVRPNDVAFGTNTLQEMTGVDSEVHHRALRAWVRENRLPLAPSEVRAHQVPPTPEEQLARAEFALAWHLHQQGKTETAERHFDRAGTLAPHDFTIRRGSMPIRGLDPMGPAFADLYSEWVGAGRPYYTPLPSGA